jgi:hypothetical protein
VGKRVRLALQDGPADSLDGPFKIRPDERRDTSTVRRSVERKEPILFVIASRSAGEGSWSRSERLFRQAVLAEGPGSDPAFLPSSRVASN